MISSGKPAELYGRSALPLPPATRELFSVKNKLLERNTKCKDEQAAEKLSLSIVILAREYVFNAACAWAQLFSVTFWPCRLARDRLGASRRHHQQLRQAHQVVRCHCEGELPAHLGQPAMAGLA